MCVDAEHKERLFSVHSVRGTRKIYVYYASVCHITYSPLISISKTDVERI